MEGMVVILKLTVPTEASPLGRTLRLRGGEFIKLESLVPSRTEPVPFFWIHSRNPEPIIEELRRYPPFDGVEVVEQTGDRTLIALDWDVRSDDVFRVITDCEGHLLRAVCQQDCWEFTVRFPKHEFLSKFKRLCVDLNIPLHVKGIYRRTDPDDDPQFGLTQPQREALVLAVESGYYAIPRRCSTAELADRLGISNQAVTERLRRAITNLATHTLLISRSAEDLSNFS